MIRSSQLSNALPVSTEPHTAHALAASHRLKANPSHLNTSHPPLPLLPSLSQPHRARQHNRSSSLTRNAASVSHCPLLPRDSSSHLLSHIVRQSPSVFRFRVPSFVFVMSKRPAEEQLTKETASAADGGSAEPSFVLYGLGFSTSTQRVLLTALELGVTYELRVVDCMKGVDNKATDYLALCPFGRVPCATIDGVTVYESRAIARTLADKFQSKAHPLMPTDFKGRAMFEQVSAQANTHTQHDVYVRLLHSQLTSTLSCFVVRCMLSVGGAGGDHLWNQGGLHQRCASVGTDVWRPKR